MEVSILKSKTGRKIKTLSKPKGLKHGQVHHALMYTLDILNRSMIKFMLLDEVGKRIFEQEQPNFDNVTGIDVGVLKRHMTESGKSMLDMIVDNIEWSEYTAYIEYAGVPIVIWIIHNELQVFQTPDIRFYTTEEFFIPNPFMRYWNMRNLIK